ncbi:MAG: hypothetical protein K6L75_04495 [Cellvibrionaceae bacterium]
MKKIIPFFIVFLSVQPVYANPAIKIAKDAMIKRASVAAAQAQRTAAIASAERARKAYSMQQNERRVAAANDKIQKLAPYKVPVRRQAPPIANDVYKRPVQNGNSYALTVGPTVLKSKISGKVGEIRAYNDLRSSGYRVRSQVTAYSTTGQKRVMDHVIQNPSTGKLRQIEVKTLKAEPTRSQASFDKSLASTGATFKGANAGTLNGVSMSMPTSVLKY